ncbi:HupE/UreJ family protein [Collimonas pratensis]|uniref:HupE / UreJ family protein n=1 Tax=Collimonas pratensis TaxID=279113 RepID=A0A127Q8M1_9BURK|nr:HupE/UreJ family protein [Collimonas pratensis]AMP05962.1 hupE / UreJ family protein [Collimonas pratensis]
MSHKTLKLALLVLLSLAAGAASAHIGQGDMAGGFKTGFLHPISGLDHVIAMVAVGLWGAQLGRPAIWVLPVTFPLVMTVGGVMGVLGVPLHGIETGIALSALVLGAMICLAVRPPLWVAGVIVAVFAICHGYAHGAELPSSANPLTFAIGFVLATGLLHACGIVLGLLYKWRAGQYVLRMGGLAIAFGGAYFLNLAMAG